MCKYQFEVLPEGWSIATSSQIPVRIPLIHVGWIYINIIMMQSVRCTMTMFIPTSVCISEGLTVIRSSQVANPSSEILSAEETETGTPPSSKDVWKSLPAPWPFRSTTGRSFMKDIWTVVNLVTTLVQSDTYNTVLDTPVTSKLPLRVLKLTLKLLMWGMSSDTTRNSMV